MRRAQPTRERGLELLEAFRPHMGRRYAAGRNYDAGPDRRGAASCLSPYIRRRLITETEVIAAAVQTHGAEAAEKFIQEVVWRSYFKGWLERRPSIWDAYREGLEADLARIDGDRALRQRAEAAQNARTGIACFDAWAEELLETGRLHNHARMWFASIWIFTLGLPWRVGADFFYRRLLDGDPASNTLGWRWVAGLHTRGKAYEAKAWNIAKFTHQRFKPKDSDFAAAAPLDHEEPEGLPPVQPLRAVVAPAPGVPTALLITEEDCLLEDFDLASLDIRAAARLAGGHLRSDRGVAPFVRAFEAGALADAARRLGYETTALSAGDPKDLAAWAVRAGARQIATSYVTTGPLRDWLQRAEPALEAEGVAFREWRRDWDPAVWRRATAGFFKVKAQIPRLLAMLEAA